MNRNMNRGMLGVLAACMLLGSAPGRAFAAPLNTGILTAGTLQTQALDASKAGTVTGTLKDGVLTFTGTGEIPENYLCENFTLDDSGYFGAIQKIVVSSGITSIAKTAFVGCGRVTSVTLPSTLTGIGENAFSYCKALTTVTLPANLRSMGEGVFKGCTAIKSITLPASLKTIPKDTFAGCTALQTVTISNGVTTLEAGAFEGCSALKTVSLPSTVTGVGEGAFRDCESMTSVKLSEGLKTLESGAFEGCTRLTSVTIPASVKTIGDSAFSNCPALTGISYAGTPAQWSAIDTGSGNTDLVRAVEGETPVVSGSNEIRLGHFYTFTPTADAFYELSSSASDGCAELSVYEKADGEWEWIDQDMYFSENGDMTDHYNFNLVVYLEKDHVYHLDMDLAGAMDVKSFTLKIKQAAPKLKSIKNVVGGVQISWDHIVDYDTENEDPPCYYRIWRKDMSQTSPKWTKVGECTGNTFIDKKAVSGKNYKYTVRCITAAPAGQRVHISGYNSTGLSTYYLTGIKVTLTNLSGGIKLSWPRVSGATGYLVYQKVNGKYKKIATITTDTTLSYTHTKATNMGASYTYAVKAYKGTKYGGWTGVSTYRLKPVSQYALSNPSAGKLRVKWSKNDKATGYYIQVATKSNFSDAKKYYVGKSSLTKDFTGLKKGVTYYVRVAAYKTNTKTNVKYYSGWSSVKSLKLKK